MTTGRTSSTDTTAAQQRIRQARRRRLLVVTLVLLATSVGGWAWRRQQEVAALPPAAQHLPPPEGHPRALQERLAQARSRALDGDAVEGLAELGRLYQENGYLAQAGECWRWLQARQPGEARWFYFEAELRRMEGDQAPIAALLEQTTRLAPDYAPAWLKLADLEFKSRRFAAAAEHYQERLRRVPRDPYARLGLVRLAQLDGRRDESRTLLEAIIRDTPGFSPAHNLYAEILATAGDAAGARQERWLGRETGRFREAEDPWLDQLHEACLHPGRLTVLATLEFQTGNGPRAIEYLKRALTVAPGDAGLHESIGDLYLKLGDATAARAALERAIVVAGPGKASPAVFVSLSEACRRLHLPDEALAAAEKGLSEGRDALELHTAKGAALTDLNRHAEAIAAYREALAQNPNDPDANFNLAISSLALGRRDEAVTALERSLTLQPTMVKSLKLLASLALEGGQLENASHYLRPLFDSNPGLPEVRQLLAQWHLQVGDAEKQKGDAAAAEREFRAGIEIDPTHPEVQAELGILLLTQGRYAEAVLPLEAYHRLQSENPQTALYLGQAYARVGRTDEARRVLIAGEALARRVDRPQTAAHCRQVLESL